jgi:hypothetical protein
MPLEAPVPIGAMTVDEEEISLVVLTDTTDETPVPVGPAETVLLVPLP